MISAKDYLERLDQEAAAKERGRGWKGTPLPYLRAWRRYAHLSQGMLADVAGLSSSCLSLLEHGHRGAAPSTIHKLADALHIAPKQLVEECPMVIRGPRSERGPNTALPYLRAWRTRAYLSQARLAEKAGVAEDTVKSIERGRERAQCTTLHALAEALEITPQQLVEGPP